MHNHSQHAHSLYFPMNPLSLFHISFLFHMRQKFHIIIRMVDGIIITAQRVHNPKHNTIYELRVSFIQKVQWNLSFFNERIKNEENKKKKKILFHTINSHQSDPKWNSIFTFILFIRFSFVFVQVCVQCLVFSVQCSLTFSQRLVQFCCQAHSLISYRLLTTVIATLLIIGN